MINFEKTFKMKLIYVFRINDETHKGLLKVGDATVSKDLSEEELSPNSSVLNKSAKRRIDSYTKTACIDYDLLYTELAIKTKNLNGIECKEAFRDYDVHRVLTNSGIQKMKKANNTGKEWFKTDLETVKNAIAAVKNDMYSLSPEQISNDKSPIVFRPEQKEAIEKTLKNFKNNNRMLWNAKMRFGKTVCALEVIKRMGFKKSIIVTHRPVVNKGWHDDFNLIFKDPNGYIYLDKNQKDNFYSYLEKGKRIVYFASVQDLRGSSEVGGKFDKNNEIFSMDWDCVIVDEAHEGTKTVLGEDVIKALVKEDNSYITKFLALSGTPFNILSDYEEDSVYTWDYMMEQRAKRDWDINNFGDSNPYEELPKMKIFTYDLGDSLGVDIYDELGEKAFNFKEFFRTWTQEDIDKKQIKAKVGSFVHEQDVKKFLNLITKENTENSYPYANEEYRNLFKHSLWLVPGVKEAKALSSMLKAHKIFGSGQFEIINVAGEGDDDEISAEALKMVRDKIDLALKNDTYTITLSCGKLTTGVTVPEWTAVMMLAGSYSTSASNYLQTIFRVQSPANINGKIKEYCYVFDFAPDRTLKMVADAVQLSSKAGKTTTGDRVILGEFLNFCPIISFQGTRMIHYDENMLLEQLKKAYADKVLKSGFDNVNLYNDELLKLSDTELKMFDNLKRIVGASKQKTKISQIDINSQGFTDEEYEKLEEINKKKIKERTQEEKEFLEKKKKHQKQRRDAISILRAISIRIPLLVYGANIDFKKDVKIEDLLNPSIVDDPSWNEFMPKGVTREMFKECIKYYDTDVFNLAGRRIRNIVKNADTLMPTERVKEIAKLFSYFKNPDKETILTPWRVVNMHMSDCLGGYDFYDEKHEYMVEEPRFVNQGQVTKDTLANSNVQILEINSKSGLYPLFVTYSIFRTKCGEKFDKLSFKEQQKIWNDIVQDSVYVICKTEMSKYITKRTLVGFNDLKINAHYFQDLVNSMKYKSDQFIRRIKNKSYWNKNGGQMNFDAIVGNPPYQEGISNDVNNSSLSKQLFPIFIQNSILLGAKYSSLITPSRWFTAEAQDKSFIKLREFIKRFNHFKKIYNYKDTSDLFSGVVIKGGVNYFLYDKDFNGLVDFYNCSNLVRNKQTRNLFEEGLDVVIDSSEKYGILKKVTNKDFVSLMTITCGRNAFGIIGKESLVNSISTEKPFANSSELRCKNDIVRYISPNKITKNINIFNSYKVFISKSSGDPNTDFKVIGIPYVAKPKSACTDSLIPIGCFRTLNEAKNLSKYLKTRFLRFMVSILKSSQNVTQVVYKFVPMQDFTSKSDINWNTGIDDIEMQLYKKYRISKEEIEFIESIVKPME